MEEIYPLKFYPIFKQKIWGGTKLKSYLGKDIALPKVGESWEISDIDNTTSVVQNGTYKNHTITQLIELYKDRFLGARVFEKYNTHFPLLFKFIDASEVLSVQLHPNDEIAQQRHNSFGKSEMWYIVEAQKEAELILGFNKAIDKTSYLEALQIDSLESILHKQKVAPGEAYNIPAGLVHAIGKGILLAEVQQTSDITYRIYDWDRVDEQGQRRELHQELALEAIDFNPSKNIKLSAQNEHLVTNQYFTVNKLTISSPIFRDLSSIDSFVVYMCVQGNATITINTHTESIKLGETVLIPACASQVNFEAKDAKLLEVYV